MKYILFSIFFSFLAVVFVPTAHAQVQCPVTPTSTNSATLAVDIPQNGTYTFWARMLARDANVNSFFLQVDGGCAFVVGDNSNIPANQLTWVNYQNGATTSSITMSLTAGVHSVVLTEREGGVQVDSIFFTDTPCIPTGGGTNCLGYVTATPAPPTNTPTPSPVTQTYTLNPIADSYVNSSSSSRNYGTSTTMYVDNNPLQISYLKFDLTPLIGKTIVSANFRVRTGSEGSNDQQRVKPVSNISWTETGITYNNRPSLGSTIATINSRNTTNSWQQVSITSTVAANVGKVFSLGIDSSGSNSINFSSRESTYKPELIIQAR